MALTVTSKTSTSISCSTDSGYTSYRWEISGNGSDATTSSNTHTFSGLSANTSYTITAYRPFFSQWQSLGSVTTSTESGGGGGAPSTPTNFRVTSATQNSISVIWDASQNATSYNLYRSGAVGRVGTTSGTTYTFGGLAPGTFYTLGVQAVNASDVSATTQTSFSTIPEQQKPSAPSQVTLSSRIDGGFILQWPSVSNATGYQMEYSLSSTGGWVSLPSQSTTTATLTNRPYGTTHFFRVRAYNTHGYSDYSNTTSSTTTPQTPTISQGVGDGLPTSINIIIGAVTGGYTDFTIERLSESGVFIDSRTTPNSGGSGNWTGLVVGSKFRFRARARLFVNNTDLYSINDSNTLLITVGGGRPENFKWTYAGLNTAGNPVIGERKTSGLGIYVTKVEWDNLKERVNKFRVYKGLGETTFTSISTGTPISALLYNQVRTAIAQVNPPISPPSTVSGGSNGTIISASHFNGVMDSLNSIV